MMTRKRILVSTVIILLSLPQGGLLAQDKAVGRRDDKPRFDPVRDPAAGSAALLVGINTFSEDENLAALHFAVNDAVATAHLFVLELQLIKPDRTVLALSGRPTGDAVGQLDALKKAGVLTRPATKAKIFRQLQRVSALPGSPDDLLIVSLSSHGFEQGGVPYVMPADGVRSFLSDTAIYLNSVEHALSTSKAGKRLLLLDACREKPLAGGRGGNAPMAQAFREALAKTGGQAVLASCDVGQVSFEDPRIGHGIFTYYLLKGLRGAAKTDDRGLIRVDQVITYVATQVEAWSRRQGPKVQQPWFKGPQAARRIPLAMDAERVAALAAAAREKSQQITRSVEALRQLAIDDKITVAQHRLGKRLLRADPAALGEQDRERLGYFLDMLAGKLDPKLLQQLLDSVETPSQRAARLERERVAAEVKTTLVKLRRAFDAKDATAAWSVYEELKKLSPTHPAIEQWNERLASLPRPVVIRGDEMVIDLGGGVTMELIRIEPGSFQMGSPASEEGREDDEGPQHRVRIGQAFYLGKTEVTQTQWRAVMGDNPSRFKGDDRPVEQVSWEDCQQFCRKLSQRTGKRIRLPSEAEWEYACRAGTDTRFSFGGYDPSLGQYAWYDDNSDGKTHPVGRQRANGWGYMTCTGTFGSGARMYGMTITTAHPMTVRRGRGAGFDMTVFCAAAVGSRIRGAAALPFATGTRRATASTATTGFALSRGLPDTLPFVPFTLFPSFLFSLKRPIGPRAT